MPTMVTSLKKNAYPRWELLQLVEYDPVKIYEFCSKNLNGSCASWMLSVNDDDTIAVFVVGDDCGDPMQRVFRICYRDVEMGAVCDCDTCYKSQPYDCCDHIDVSGDDLAGLTEAMIQRISQ